MNSHFTLVCPHQGLLLLSSSFWHLVEMLSQSISFFYSMPTTKSLTMPYHLNKGKQKHRKLNQLFPGPRKSRFNYKPRLLMERRAYSYSMLADPASQIRINEWCDDDQAERQISSQHL
uniref:Uncharacterized protein n=2 Tax=Opuntia streptacantha TaxID=393608 RepID=A0A7C8ZST9_OPUST